MKRILQLAAAASAFALAIPCPGSADDIATLLNTPSSCGTAKYAEAASAVAKEAAAGRPLQQFLLALVSRKHDMPKSAKLDDATCERYLAEARPRIMSLAKDKDNPLAWYLLAVETNDEAMLEKAARLGNIQAMNTLATSRLSKALAAPLADDSAREVMEASFKAFSATAAGGDANGLNNLGICLLKGYGCRRDEKRAFECFSKASDLGHPEAINNLGRFYREGIVVEKDLTQAARCFVRSASLGNEWGKLNYASVLLTGDGVEKNPRLAVELLEGVARNGCVDAMELLARCCERGDGMDGPDMHKAAVWKVRVRARRGDENAKKWLKANGEEP